MKKQNIYDDSINCFCNEHKGEYCNGKCKCYCHIPIWFRNVVWKFINRDDIGFKDLLKKEQEFGEVEE